MRRCLACHCYAVTGNTGGPVAPTMCEPCATHYQALAEEFPGLAGQSLVALVRCRVFITSTALSTALLDQVRQVYEQNHASSIEVRYWEEPAGPDECERGVEIAIGGRVAADG